jgi:hypothetical protein
MAGIVSRYGAAPGTSSVCRRAAKSPCDCVAHVYPAYTLRRRDKAMQFQSRAGARRAAATIKATRRLVGRACPRTNSASGTILQCTGACFQFRDHHPQFGENLRISRVSFKVTQTLSFGETRRRLSQFGLAYWGEGDPIALLTGRNEVRSLSADKAHQRFARSSKMALLSANEVRAANCLHCTARARQNSEVCGDFSSGIAAPLYSSGSAVASLSRRCSTGWTSDAS